MYGKKSVGVGLLKFEHRMLVHDEVHDVGTRCTLLWLLLCCFPKGSGLLKCKLEEAHRQSTAVWHGQGAIAVSDKTRVIEMETQIII